jgi:3-oxoacyl-[acyl-carrier protein] reductase
MDFKGQVAFITGAARGIGRAIAAELAAKGADIAIGDLGLEEARAAADDVAGTSGVKAKGYALNVADPGDVERAFGQIKDDFGKLDVLINNAGITKDSLLIRMKPEDWDAVLSVNLKGAFLCSKEAVKMMSKSRYGRIVSISSVVAFMGNPGQANYCASKAGLLGLTKSIAKEYASRGITANAVAPGFITTAMTEKLPEDVKAKMLALIPMEKFGAPEDVARAAAFLASPGAGYISGQVIHVSGGMYT